MSIARSNSQALSGIRRRSLRLGEREAITFYLLLSPWVLGFLVFTLGPMVASLFFSFTQYNVFSPPRWVGIGNLRELGIDPLFWQSLRVTAAYALMSLLPRLVIALMLALLLNQPVKGISIFRTIFYLPAVVSGVAVAILWAWVLHPDFGVLNTLLSYVGIRGPGWIYDTQWALPSLALVSLWGVGGPMMIYLAGLQGVPAHLYEAAEIDGAGEWTKFARITLPMLTPMVFFNLVMGIIGTFQVFAQPYVMTRGGPVNATLLYVLYLYQTAFECFKLGMASAMAWILFLLILMLTLLVVRTSRWVYYETEVR